MLTFYPSRIRNTGKSYSNSTFLAVMLEVFKKKNIKVPNQDTQCR
jgi:hypothetical protein